MKHIVIFIKKLLKMAIKELIDEVKNLIKNNAVTTLIDVEGNEVVFEVTTEEDIAEGVTANKDGVFVFGDGKTITVENGKVVKIEKVEEKIETPVEGGEKETEEKTSEEEVVVEEPKVEELIQQVEELSKKVETLVEEVKEKEEEIVKMQNERKEIETELTSIRNFYSKLNSTEPAREEAPKAENEPAERTFKFKYKSQK